MMIALPTEQWEVFGQRSAKELAAHLRDWASKINMEKIGGGSVGLRRPSLAA
jgi:hypothetical protein